MATAANTSATPSQPSSPSILFNILTRCSVVALLTGVIRASATAAPSAPPPFAVHRLGGQEQPEGDETQVIHDVFGVDDAAREIVEVIDDRQVVEHRPHRRS